MELKDRDKVLHKMLQLAKKVDEKLDSATQKRENISYYKDFQFEGSGIGAEDVYIVYISNKKTRKNADKSDDFIKTYEIYTKEGELIATVSEEGKIQFEEQYIKKFKGVNGDYTKEFELSNIDFVPEELRDEDLEMTREELEEYKRESEGKEGKGNYKKEEKTQEQETEDEKRQRTAEAIGIEESEVGSIVEINPNEKITDKYNLVDIMPETEEYERISIVWSNTNHKGNGEFTILGIAKDGTREQINSVQPIEGTSTNKNVISVNEDGTKVEEKQVQGLFIINSGNRNHGISVSRGNYNMMNVDFVSDVMDKKNRRSTPIRTTNSENQRKPISEVRENAGDSLGEIKKEGENFRNKEEEGVEEQSLDGIDTNKEEVMSKSLDEVKENIKEQALEKEDVSQGELKEFIEGEIYKSGLELTEEEKEQLVEEISGEVKDELRFPTYGDRK